MKGSPLTYTDTLDSIFKLILHLRHYSPDPLPPPHPPILKPQLYGYFKIDWEKSGADTKAC